MYTVLKTKRCHFEVQNNGPQAFDKQTFSQNQVYDQNKQIIVSSCFLDDAFILFLFNSGRYIIVNSISSSPSLLTKKSKKAKTIESQIIYDGHILYQRKDQNINAQLQDQQIQYPPPKLLPKTSLKLIEENSSKIIFSDCKRIKINECIIITRHSRNVYWLKISKILSNTLDISKSIKTEVLQLPGTMLSQLLHMDNTQLTNNLTILTELIEFDNSSDNKIHGQMKKLVINPPNQKGSFCIKNQIIEDKMIYMTVYTRIPISIGQKNFGHTFDSFRSKQMNQRKFPEFILTKFEFSIPINEVNSNFMFEVSDKYNNEIAIYKQCEDGGIEWEIKLYRFDFRSLEGEKIVQSWSNQFEKKEFIHLNEVSLVIEKEAYLPKPKIIVLPQQFTSSINLQQFIRLDQGSTITNETTYMIISINQTFTENQQNVQPPLQGGVVHLNGQQFYLDLNGNLHPRQVNITSNKCWIHLCKLTFNQNTDNFTQWIERKHNFSFESTSFLKIINVNYEFQILYILGLAHQVVDEQLYQNKIDLVDLKTGHIIEKGYCSLKNYSFSPNQKYILDAPSIISTQTDFYYHIRLLFDKKSLYLSMIENAKNYFQPYQNVNFIQTLLNLL